MSKLKNFIPDIWKNSQPKKNLTPKKKSKINKKFPQKYLCIWCYEIL